MKCEYCGSELPDAVKTVTIDGYEYDIEDHDKGKKLKDIVIPKGSRLWTREETERFHNNPELRKKLNLADCWFFVKQPYKVNEEKGYVTRFYANSDGCDLGCRYDSADSFSALGVRFAKKIP